MFNAELVIRRSPGEPIEPTAYPVDPALLAANYQHMLPIMQAASATRVLTFPPETRLDGTVRAGGSFDALVGTVTAEALLAALNALAWLRPGYFSPDLAYVAEITGTAAVKDWVVIAPQPKDTSRKLEGLGLRAVASRVRRRGDLFGALSDPKHRPPAARIAGARSSWGDAYIESLTRERRGALLVYPVAESTSASKPNEVVVAFTLFAPKAARAANGQIVQFRAKDTGSPKAAIVTTTTD